MSCGKPAVSLVQRLLWGRCVGHLYSASSVMTMRTNTPPFNDVRVRRATPDAIDREGINGAIWVRAAPTSAVPSGLVPWSLPIEQLGEEAKYYWYDPQEARALLAQACYSNSLKTQFVATGL